MQGPTSTHATRDFPTDTASADRGGHEPVPAPVSQPSQLSKLMHDLNQPLSAITNYAQAGSQLVANGAVDTERLKSLFDKIVQQSGRAAAISQELRKAQDAPPETPSR